MAINMELIISTSEKLVVVTGARNVLFAVQNRGTDPVEVFFGTASQILQSGQMHAAPLDNSGELSLRCPGRGDVLIQSQ